jgi:UDP-glucose 4-epimerase
VTTVLVTGAGGYIGQRLVLRLAADGHLVRALVRESPVGGLWGSEVEQVMGDLVTEPGLAGEIAGGVEVVVHLAGANEVVAAADPERAVPEAVVAAERVAESGVGRVLYLSTVHVYGHALRSGAVVGEDTPAQPVYPYAVARLACEEVLRGSGVPSMVFRLTNGVGAPAHPDVRRWSLVANDLCREGAVSGRLTLRTPGVGWRDFVALADVEAALSLFVGAGSFRAGLYNMGSGRCIRVRDLAEMIQASFVAAGEPEPELVAPPVPAEAAEAAGAYVVDVSRLGELWDGARTPLRSAVDETVRFCLEHREALRAAPR